MVGWKENASREDRRTDDFWRRKEMSKCDKEQKADVLPRFVAICHHSCLSPIAVTCMQFDSHSTLVATVILPICATIGFFTLSDCLKEAWSGSTLFVVSVFIVAACRFLWNRPRSTKPQCIGNCRHESCSYDCYPPYTSPGGLQTLFSDSRKSTAVWFLPLYFLRYLLFPRFPCSKMQRQLHRASSFSSDDSRPSNAGDETLPPPILVYHESARSIVFRDHVRRADAKKHANDDANKQEPEITIANFQPRIQPLPSLDLGPQDQFQALIDEGSNEDTWNNAEKEVVGLLRDEHAVVKTLRNSDWTAFLDRFRKPQESRYRSPNAHDDIPTHDDYHFNSFVTSTTLLPEYGKKMRCYGSVNEYLTGTVFALPRVYKNETEDDAVARTQTWAWPSGYSAKTEFNIDGRGNLINGREEALVSLNTLRAQNHDYVYEKDYCKYYNGLVLVDAILLRLSLSLLFALHDLQISLEDLSRVA